MVARSQLELAAPLPSRGVLDPLNQCATDAGPASVLRNYERRDAPKWLVVLEPRHDVERSEPNHSTLCDGDVEPRRRVTVQAVESARDGVSRGRVTELSDELGEARLVARMRLPDAKVGRPRRPDRLHH